MLPFFVKQKLFAEPKGLVSGPAGEAGYARASGRTVVGWRRRRGGRRGLVF